MQQSRLINNSSQLNMFREIILPIFRSTRLCVTACGTMHPRCCRLVAFIYLYQWCTFKKISDNEIYLLIKYIKSVLWRAVKRLSYTEDARCLKVKYPQGRMWLWWPTSVQLIIRTKQQRECDITLQPWISIHEEYTVYRSHWLKILAKFLHIERQP